MSTIEKIEEDEIGWENKMVRTGLTEKVTSVQRFGGGEKLRYKDIWGKVFRQSRVSAKARRQSKLGSFKEEQGGLLGGTVVSMEESSGCQGGDRDHIMRGLAGHFKNIALDSE